VVVRDLRGPGLGDVQGSTLDDGAAFCDGGLDGGVGFEFDVGESLEVGWVAFGRLSIEK